MVLWLLPLILGYGENPLPEMTSLAEAHGIRLFSLPTVGRDVDAFSFMFDGVPYVAVDTSKTAERVRFDIAHEIGHLMMHEMVSEDVAIPSLRGGDVFLDSLTGRRTSSWRSTAGSSATEPWTCTSNTNAAPPT